VSPDRAFHVTVALVFAASAAATIAWCGSMAAMPGMAMAGGWTMSMAWMRMPGQGWLGFGGTFLGMWAVMMLAMMMPVAAPMLARYRRAVRARNVDVLTAWVGGGYFAVWVASAAALLPFGVVFAEWTMQSPAVSRAVPVLGALAILAAGASQFTAWKLRMLACCRHSIDCLRDTEPNYRAAWRHGLKIGLRCVRCCAALTAVLLVIGVMDLRAMALVTMAISAERLMPASLRAARATGAILLVAGSCVLFDALTGFSQSSSSHVASASSISTLTSASLRPVRAGT
jgi:predicted metal-binding membrane protein